MKKWMWTGLLLLSAMTQSRAYDIVINPVQAEKALSAQALRLEAELREVFLKSAVFRVLDRGNLEFIMKEQSYQLAGITDETDSLIGQLKNAGFLLVSSLCGSEKPFLLRSEIIDIRSSELVYAETVEINQWNKSRILLSGMADRAQQVFLEKYAYTPWMDRDSYYTEMLSQFSNRYYPRIVEGRVIEGISRYRAWFIPFPPGYFYFYTLHGQDKTRYQYWKKQWESQGFRMQHLQIFRDASGTEHYQGTWIRLSN